ncbi:MAG: tail-specific protease [bacterium]|nr:tail-specific protease [bacterium]
MNLTRPTPLSIIGVMMHSYHAPKADPGSSKPEILKTAKRRRVPSTLACLVLTAFLGNSLAPTGAIAFTSPELTCANSWDLVQSLLKRHISFRGLDSELRERVIDTYIERIDPSKTLYLSHEISKLRNQLKGVFFAVQNGECGLLDEIRSDLVERYERMQEEVTSYVSREAYALDTDVRLILDPGKRGHPPDDEARLGLVIRLVHFTMSNYLSSDMELEKAKEKLIHRYELMTKRASELEPRDTYADFLNAFAGALDPHSTYYPPEAVEDFQIQMSLSLDGIGIALSSKDGYSIVERIIPGGATDKTGALEPGDKIIAVAQEKEEPVDIIDMSLRDVVSMIRGERGTTVKLTILRKSDTTERFDVAIQRDKVTIEDAAATLDFHEIEVAGTTRKLAVLDLPTFYGDADPSKRQSGRDVRDLLRQIREAKAEGVLLDLSRNGGGKLESSVDIAGLFIREGGVVAVKNVFSEVQILEDRDEDIVYDGPLVILTSRITASASEIVAGAMKDYGRAVIVGDDHTFGKGTVQSFIHQPGRLGAIKVTTAMFFRPGGASTQHEGVAADIVLPSLFATDDLGERYAPYSLKSQMIPPFLSMPSRVSNSLSSLTTPSKNWKDLSDGVMAELRRRSTLRVSSDDEFIKINEQLAKFAEEDDVIHLAEFIREREEKEAEKTASGDGSDSDEKNDQASDEAGASQPEDSEGKTGGKTPESYTEEEDEEPTPQRMEALRILADLVGLQETARSSWHAPQSASRLESSSSQQ